MPRRWYIEKEPPFDDDDGDGESSNPASANSSTVAKDDVNIFTVDIQRNPRTKVVSVNASAEAATELVVNVT